MAQKSVKLAQLTDGYISVMDSPLGKLVLQSTDQAITSIHIAGFRQPADLPEISPDSSLPSCLHACKSQLRAYFEGTRKKFDLPISLYGTTFQQKVWNELLNIPFGSTISYLELARRLGDPKVIRAAGSANGKNPVAIIIPCHRVIGSDGSLIGYAGGLENKRWLLEHEQIHSGGKTQLSIF
jgi:methylated-DNA-[protein]-cysteine S-methyltransferase